jgi:hypothetical protein
MSLHRPTLIGVAVALVALGIVLALLVARWLPAHQLKQIAATTVQDLRNGDYSRLDSRHEDFHNSYVGSEHREALARRILLGLIGQDSREGIIAAFVLGEGAHNYGFTPVFKSNHRAIMPHAISLAQEDDPELARFGHYILADMILSPDAFHAGRKSWPPADEMLAHFRAREEEFYGKDESWSKKLHSRTE